MLKIDLLGHDLKVILNVNIIKLLGVEIEFLIADMKLVIQMIHQKNDGEMVDVTNLVSLLLM